MNHFFLSVDTSFFRSNEVIFTFLPRHEMEAREFVSNLVPYYFHKNKNVKLHQIFHPEALERASETLSNEETEEVVTSIDLYLDSSDNIKDDFDMLEVMGIETVKQNTTVETERVQRLFAGEEATSVGSLFTQPAAELNAQNFNSNQNVITPNNVSISAKSVCTTLTIEDVDKKVDNMSTEIAQIKDMLKILTNKNNPDQNQSMDIADNMGQQCTAGETQVSICQQP
jgi:hypothetical protein